MSATVSPKELSSLISLIYDKKGLAKSILGVEGHSGIGKTEICMASVKSMENFSECRVLNVAHLNTEDLGIPRITDEYVEFKFTKTIFQPPVNGGRVLVILDEFNRPPNDNVLNTLMGVTNERRLMGEPIPEWLSFIGTLNPKGSDYPQTMDLFRDLAMRRRIQSVELRFDVVECLDYFESQKVDETLMSFLRANPDQILLPGKINCPRNWMKFEEDILHGRKWGKTPAEIKGMIKAASCFMDEATLPLFNNFWRGNLEKPVKAKDIMDNWKNSKSKIETQMKENKVDLLQATAGELRSVLKTKTSLTESQKSNLKGFMLTIHKALFYTIAEDLVQNSTQPWLVSFFLDDAELHKILQEASTI